MDSDELRTWLERHGEALTAAGAAVDPPVVEPPAQPGAIDALEARLGLTLPATLRQSLEGTTAGVRWSWQLESDRRFPPPYDEIFSGGLDWSIETLPDAHETYLGWVGEVFSNPEDPYDAVWHDKLGLLVVPNGDIVGVDLATETAGTIVYLSHEDGEGHGVVMARSLEDLLDRWVPLGCPGPEEWQWLPFVANGLGPIDPVSPLAAGWRSLVGLTQVPRADLEVRPDEPRS